jgi:hypothetical protein
MSWAAVGIGLLLAVGLIAGAVRWSGRRAVETVSPFDDVPQAPPGDDGPDGVATTTDPPEPDASG